MTDRHLRKPGRPGFETGTDADLDDDRESPHDWFSGLDLSDLDLSDDGGEPPELLLDVPYVPTERPIITAMLDLADVRRRDILYDLGCGDGRIVITAARERGTRGIGVDLDPMRVADAMELAGNARAEHLTDFIEADLLDVDISEATVLVLYLHGLVNLELRPRLLGELSPGTRIVSQTFDMGDWKPDQHRRLGSTNLYLWRVPAAIGGTWQWRNQRGDEYRVHLEQQYQQITGQAWINGQEARLHHARLQGDLLELAIRPHQQGKAHDFTMRWQPDQQLHPAGDHDQDGPATRVPG